MNNYKDDDYYVNKMLADLRFIREHMDNVSMKTLGENNMLSLDSSRECFFAFPEKIIIPLPRRHHRKNRRRSVRGLS